MRKDFSNILHDFMAQDEKIILLTGDLGYGLWDKIRMDFPQQFYNFGSSEQLMVGAAAGMASSGCIPIVYSITPFVLYRPFEFIRNFMDHEKIPVKLLGGGRDKDYGYLGFSHWATEDKRIMGCFDNIESYWPEDEDLVSVAKEFVYNQKPSYLNLKR